MSDSKKVVEVLRALASMHDEECPSYKRLNDKADKLEASSKGPANVNSAEYRTNYESIFGAKQPVGQA